MKSKISIITLGVTDLERSVTFYRDGLGFSTQYDGSEGIAFFTLENITLALFPIEELAKDAHLTEVPPVGQSMTLAHNVESKEKVNEVIDFATRAGATLQKEPQDVFWGGYSGYFKDPDGYLWEVAWNPFMDLT